VPPADLLAHLRAEGLPVEARFRGETDDPTDWFAVDLSFDDASPVILERYQTDADDIRGELNAWAAFLETADWSMNAPRLMEAVIATQQLFAPSSADRPRRRNSPRPAMRVALPLAGPHDRRLLSDRRPGLLRRRRRVAGPGILSEGRGR